MHEPYRLVLADPPWSYRNKRTGGSHTSGSAQKYPTLPLDQIVGLPVPEVMAQDAVCFLWGTTPMGDDPSTVLRQWGFTYKTKWYWHKVGRKGTGYWTRGEVEELLIGVRGDVRAWRSGLSNYIETVDAEGGVLGQIREQATRHLRASAEPDLLLRDLELIALLLNGDPDSVHIKPTGHSQKPEVVQDRIDQLEPTGARLELFATRHRPGWDCFGLALDPTHDVRDPEFWHRLRG